MYLIFLRKFHEIINVIISCKNYQPLKAQGEGRYAKWDKTTKTFRHSNFHILLD